MLVNDYEHLEIEIARLEVTREHLKERGGLISSVVHLPKYLPCIHIWYNALKIEKASYN
jgi:hypothetical protein